MDLLNWNTIKLLEDGIELCLAAVGEAKTLKDAYDTLEGYLSIVKEQKIAAMKTDLMIFGDIAEAERSETSQQTPGKAEAE